MTNEIHGLVDFYILVYLVLLVPRFLSDVTKLMHARIRGVEFS
jgi:hypothetical protein